ncbi:MAG: 2OG-Fe(II) oxygenase [Myxococcales bacterium]|nr:2OG-Fe(II) oxygenase [Myxococcales bacterium]
MMEAKYSMRRGCSLQMETETSVAIIPEPGATPRRLPVELASFLLHLGSPRSARQIHAASGARTLLADLTRLLDRLCAEGILVKDEEGPTASGPSLASALRRDVFGDAATVTRVGEHLRAGRLVVIRDALPRELAERVHHELDASGAWGISEGRAPYFGYRQHKIRETSEHPGSVREVAALFGSEQTKAFIAELSGQSCAGEVVTVPSWFQAGDYILPHEDCGDGRRTVAYVWHLTRAWNESWGGDFVWCPTGTLVRPAFNQLVMFTVGYDEHHNSLHAVSVVGAHAQGKRLAVNGWWHRPEPLEREDAGSPPSRPGDEGMSPHRYGPPRAYLGQGDGVTIV